MLKKKLNDREILLVLVCDSKEKLDQQLALLRSVNLFTPEGCTFSAYPVIGRKNLAASFNKIQKESNAKFKIYLTEPISQVDNTFIHKMIEAFFVEPKTAMVGLMGSEMPIDGDYTQAKNFYGMYTYKDENNEVQNYLGKDPLYYQSVHMLDNGFFATNEDIHWDEKVGNDFLLAAHCLNFRSKGYDVGVVYQEKPFMIFEKDSFNYTPKADEQNYSEQLETFHKFYGKKFQPLVSILIPTYNQPKFCQEALISALSQSYENIEILVGDDSTNEDTKKMIKPFLKKNPVIKYFYHNGKIPRGGGPNMSFLLNHCSGEYVNFLLHDDLFHPQKISKMMQYFVADLEDEIGLISSARALVNEKTQFIRRRNPWQPKSDTMISGKQVGRRLLFILANFIGELTTVLFKKKDVALKKSLPGIPNFAIGNFCGVYSSSYGDMDTWLEILKSGKSLIFMTEALSFFRQHAEQNTYNPNTRITLPLDALNFVTVAWLNDAFFKNVEDFYYCLDKWVILADRWFVPIAEDDEEIIKKRKEWIIKLRRIFETHNYAKMTDAAISYLLESVTDYSPVYNLVKNNLHTGLLEKNTNIAIDTKNLDECENYWQVHGVPQIKNGMLILNGSSWLTCSRVFTFGRENHFTIETKAQVGKTAAGIFPSIFSLYYSNDERIRVCAQDGGTRLVGKNNATMWAEWDTPVCSDKLHHIAVSYDGTKFYFFFDGQLINSAEISIKTLIYVLEIGVTNMLGTVSFHGIIDELRVSDVCRYTENFTPAERFEVDENTLSLLHFDE